MGHIFKRFYMWAHKSTNPTSPEQRLKNTLEFWQSGEREVPEPSMDGLKFMYDRSIVY